MRALLLLLIASVAAPAAAQQRDFCPSRPGLGASPCTIERGRIAVELGIADWTLDRQADSRTDTLLLGDLLLRLGLGDRLEVQIGWAAFGRERERPLPNVRAESRSATGDVMLALSRNLANPDGSGFSAGIIPFVTVPIGGEPTGAGAWGAGLIVPLSQELPGGLSLEFTGSVEAAPDEDRSGRHLAYGGILGLGFPLAGQIDGAAELSLRRDEDPASRVTELLGGLSFGWMANPDLQIDAGANLGLNAASPDLQLYFGISRRF